MIEKYYHSEDGYNPFLIREGWQVAQLNYVAQHGLDDIDTIEVHKATDEVFILVEGTAVLVEAVVHGQDVHFEALNMKRGVTYNIPAGVWHNIAMAKDAKIIIVEKSNTHLNDCAYMNLSQMQRQTVYGLIAHLL